MKNIILISLIALGFSFTAQARGKSELGKGRQQCSIIAGNILKAFRMADKDMPQVDVLTSSIQPARKFDRNMEVMTYVIEGEKKSLAITMHNHGSTKFCSLMDVKIKSSKGK